MAVNYFTEFPDIYYPFKINGKEVLTVVKDITVNTRIRAAVLENVTIYDEYDIVEGETPEIISEKFYNSPYYHWVIMLVNQRYDYIADFPLPQVQLENFIADKYGEGKEDEVHHWETEEGYIVHQGFAGATSVSNRQHEERINEGKRRIKIISPTLLPRILDQLKNLV